MRIFINTELCIGCENCVYQVPGVFDMEDELAIVIEADISDGLEDKVQGAVELCPVEAIRIEE